MNIVSSFLGNAQFHPPSVPRLVHLPSKRGSSRQSSSTTGTTSSCSCLPAFLAAAVLFSFPTPPEETLAKVPRTLSGDDGKQVRIQRLRSVKAESCTVKCVTTCIRGGAGSPGEGPLNVRRPLVVFKQGFRTRQYCLSECSDICNLIKDGEDGP
ncbi:hypothetical protein HPP92_017711 [Vanilla planifolia]|uniref:Uncharacterized protein n=1 Tax=Vanilla planifolia TaxID=51239 RepID=A0A835PGU8_VANPL|nr:hypothetical protein HPP92_026441 [Vanilla planifolia]KAG0468383.1 hypothetical protein HPP92_017711 [Vanilla planifolia]